MLVALSRKLSRNVDRLSFGDPVRRVYNPLSYARIPHEKYLERYGQGRKRALLVGMNPGPFGMAQTGVPFGDVVMVRDYLGISGRVDRPTVEHPKRPILGFDCPRREVSGSRLWGWVRQRFGAPGHFFEEFFVHNYCPLVFMTESGSNFTPDKLPAMERTSLFAVCDDALRGCIKALEPEWVLGVGAFAGKRARESLAGADVQIGTILHPSPASPKANQGWAKHVERELHAYGLL